MSELSSSVIHSCVSDLSVAHCSTSLASTVMSVPVERRNFREVEFIGMCSCRKGLGSSPGTWRAMKHQLRQPVQMATLENWRYSSLLICKITVLLCTYSNWFPAFSVSTIGWGERRRGCVGTWVAASRRACSWGTALFTDRFVLLQVGDKYKKTYLSSSCCRKKLVTPTTTTATALKAPSKILMMRSRLCSPTNRRLHLLLKRSPPTWNASACLPTALQGVHAWRCRWHRALCSPSFVFSRDELPHKSTVGDSRSVKVYTLGQSSLVDIKVWFHFVQCNAIALFLVCGCGQQCRCAGRKGENTEAK